MAICDFDKRFRYLYVGLPGSSHDQRGWDNSQIGINTNQYFSEDQYLLADSGYRLSEEVIVPYKRGRGRNLSPEEERFNKALSSQRMKIEHAFGLLKNRFQNLKTLTTQISTPQQLDRCLYFVKATVIVHNFLLDEEGESFWEDRELEDLRAEVEEEAAEEVDEMGSALVELLDEGESGDRRATLKRKMERSGYRRVYNSLEYL